MYHRKQEQKLLNTSASKNKCVKNSQNSQNSQDSQTGQTGQTGHNGHTGQTSAFQLGDIRPKNEDI